MKRPKKCRCCRVLITVSNYGSKGLCYDCRNKIANRKPHHKDCSHCGDAYSPNDKDFGWCRFCFNLEVFRQWKRIKMCDVINGEVVELPHSEVIREAREMGKRAWYMDSLRDTDSTQAERERGRGKIKYN